MSTIYHFDINGTILGTDSTDEKAHITDAIYEGLARSIWLKFSAFIKMNPHSLKENIVDDTFAIDNQSAVITYEKQVSWRI